MRVIENIKNINKKIFHYIQTMVFPNDHYIDHSQLYAYNVIRSFSALVYLLTLIGSIAPHAFVNITNDYFDTLYGVDKLGTPTTKYRPHLIFSLTLKQTIPASLLVFFIALSCNIALANIGRPLSIPLGLLGP